MPPEIRLRDATAADVDSLAPLLEQLGYPTEVDTLRQRFARVSASGERVIVAEAGADIVGLMTVHPCLHLLHRPRPVARITTLVVRDSARGTGVGRALVGEAERIGRAEGCEMIEVTSNMRRDDAHAFYERLGYDRTSYRFGRKIGES